MLIIENIYIWVFYYHVILKQSENVQPWNGWEVFAILDLVFQIERRKGHIFYYFSFFPKLPKTAFWSRLSKKIYRSFMIWGQIDWLQTPYKYLLAVLSLITSKGLNFTSNHKKYIFIRFLDLKTLRNKSFFNIVDFLYFLAIFIFAM